MRRARLTLGVIAMAIVACFTITSRDRWRDGARERMADYLFMEAQRQSALDNASDYFEILNRAYLLDTTQTAVGHDLGYLYMMMADNDTTLFYKGYRMMRRHFDLHPGDYYASSFYGQVNDRLRDNEEALRVWTIMDSLYPHKIEVTFKLAEALANMGDTAHTRQSIDVYNRIETAEGKQIGVTSRKIRSYYALGDTAAILDELHALLAESPNSVDFNIFAGDIFSVFHRVDSALYYLNRACQLDSTNGVARFKRSNIYLEMGDSVRFDTEVFNALSRGDLDLEIKLEMLRNYIMELYNDPAQSQRILNLFSVIQEQHPHEADIHDMYAAYLMVINDTVGATEQISLALDINPADAQRWRGLQSLYLQLDDYDKAIATGERGLHYHPDNTMLWLMTASAYSQSGNMEKAFELYDKAYESADSANTSLRSSILASIADDLYRIGRQDSAFAYYDRAIEIDPGNIMALNNYAYFLSVNGGDLDKAEQMSFITVRNDPKNPTYLDTYAWVLFKKGDYATARQYIDSAMIGIEGRGDAADLYEHAGDIYFMDGDPDKALDYWKRALELNPDNELLQRKVKHKTFFYK